MNPNSDKRFGSIPVTMCGIAGAKNQEKVEQLLELQSHRGQS
ncbi:MAG: hypothetical protein ACLFRK_02630 [Candidatus Nanohaloarchaea archaeon]